MLIVLVVSIFQCVCTTEKYQAASSYTNAKEFYESTALKGESYHAEMVNGTIYYATCGKVARSSTNLVYTTVGFDIELSANGHSVLFSVKRAGGSMTQIDSKTSGGYEYILYAVEDDVMYDLASKANSTVAAYVLGASEINVKMDAILVTKQGNSYSGGIEENGSGGITKWGTIYRLKDSADLSALKRIFTGHTFESYKEIKEKLPNYSLRVRYAMNGTDEANVGCTSVVTVGENYRLVNYTKDGVTIPYVLYADGTLYTSSSKTINQISILNPDDVGALKTGYHLVDGEEWVTDSRRYFTHTSYMPKDIDYAVGYQNIDLYFFANWQPNTYTVHYDPNGGVGTVPNDIMTYDIESKLANNTYYRRGYHLDSGEEWVNDDGIACSNGMVVMNLTSVNNGTYTYWANWKNDVYQIKLDNQGADLSEGTKEYFLKYDIGNFSEGECKTSISKITVPEKEGHLFRGYFTDVNGSGIQYIAENGTILSEKNTFTYNTTLYAYWEPISYTIRYHANGGNGVMADVEKSYREKTFPLDMSIYYWTGRTFEGWATSSTGSVIYKDKQLINGPLSNKDGDIINLYAVWKSFPVPITLDKQGGTGGTDVFYGKYDIGFYSDESCDNNISSIIAPTKTGYTFQGYHEEMSGFGDKMILSTGVFDTNKLKSTTYLEPVTLYAHWTPNEYSITFDKQGGTGGTDSVKVVYDSLVPSADAPIRSGYTFKGYWTEKNGKGVMYYNENMASDTVYKETKNITLYAYWVDESAPTIELYSNTDRWINSRAYITAKTKDVGTGLSSFVVYKMDNTTGVFSPIYGDGVNLNGSKDEIVFTYDNTTEGSIRYKAVATDIAGNTAEAYCVVLYDVTAPIGRNLGSDFSNRGRILINIDVTDSNVKP